ncbi:hypothetical protein [Roseisolibacter sp. H3M3-2]|uniref:RCC1 domain-containing protein n=1 Tax=Roseisolibacter sp. H3M3-2 TaxID=3031323 RepID=UPI0023DC5BBC|nr:hypothetical protein [Roseisolibacter sp. H3M3-2]MDF1505188.1 hypothetical protein [Roseisolibacter sp. H3M3-2]
MRLRRSPLAAALVALLGGCAADPATAPSAPSARAPAVPEEASTAVAGGATIALPFGAACALGGAGRAYCWGSNADGIGGDPARSGYADASTAPRPVSGDGRYVALAATATDQRDTPLTVCALTADGEVDCWGANVGGLLGAADARPCGAEVAGTTHPCNRAPTRLATALRFRRLAVGPGLLCGIASDGLAYCWGDGPSGQLGAGTGARRAAAPTRVAGDHRFVDLAAGETVVCGLTGAGAAWCWGEGTLGQLGDGRSASSDVPVRVATAEPLAQVAPHDRYTCGVTRAGGVLCWGWGAYWTLGSPTPARFRGANVPTPEFVPLRVGALSIAIGAGHHCVRAVSGEAVCWGWNLFHQNGPPDRPGCTGADAQADCTPGPAAPGIAFTELRTGSLNACGRAGDGAVHCWGFNAYGESGGPPGVAQARAARIVLP